MKNANLKEFNRPLNNAIAYVICAKFKKDAINAFEAVTGDYTMHFDNREEA